MRALITGVTGQVGSFMAEYLLEKGYDVHAIDRRKSVANYANCEGVLDRITLIEAELTDPMSMDHVIRVGQYDEIYNFAAQSHVKTSFEQPWHTFDVNTIGVLNILENVKSHSPHSKIYQSSTSEMMGNSPPPQSETTPFHPRSPYGVSKLAAHYLVINYRESYGLKAACGIMFNTESERRGVKFVTRKITEWAKAYDTATKLSIMPPLLELGNLDAKRDWSYALDSIEAIYRICNQDKFNKSFDGTWKCYTFGSGIALSVRDFLDRVMCCIYGLNSLSDRFEFQGTGVDEVLFDKEIKQVAMRISKEYFRPAEVDYLLCDPSRIKADLGWSSRYTLDDMVKRMLGIS